MADDEPRGITHLDAAAVKVLAHPLRTRLLSALRRGGAASATALAADLQTNSGATSYHLRRLASVGLVVDTGEGKGKERLWRAASDRHSWSISDFAADEDAATALGWLERYYVSQLHARADAWFDRAAEWPTAWADHLGVSDLVVVVTPEQLVALQEEQQALLERYRDAGRDDPAARSIAVYAYALPVDPEPGDGAVRP